MTKRIRSAEHHRWAVRDGRRAVLAVLMLAFVAATSFSDGKLLPDFMTRDAPAVIRAGLERPVDDFRTGTILVTPKDGNICEQRSIDNETWRIRSSGTVPCEAAVTWQPQRNDSHTSHSRLEAIRNGFVTKR